MAILAGAGGRRWASRTVLGAGALVVVYVVLGYTIAPVLMVPLGCEGGYGDPAVGYAPGTTFDIAYNNHSDTLTVTHAGGDTIPEKYVDVFEIRVADGSGTNETVYTWTESGGTFPIAEADSVTIQSPTVDGRPVDQGTVVRTIWNGAWPDPHPDHCPNSHPTSGQATLARETL